DGFGVAGGAVLVSGPLQFRTDIRMVEDFAVVDDPQRAVLIGHGLLPGGHVDDAQPAVAQMGPSVLMVAEAVRSAMLKHRCHPLYDGGLRIAGTARGEARDPAHIVI